MEDDFGFQPDDGTQPEENEFGFQPDETPEKSSIFRRGIVDPLVGLAKGVAVRIPETAVGIANIPTFGMAGKLIDKAGGVTEPGGGFKQVGKVFENLLTPETREAQRKVSEAEGFWPTVKTALENPSALAQVVVESIPAMYLGAKIPMGPLGLGQTAELVSGAKVAGAAGEVARKELLRRATIRGGIGEGLVTAGQNIEQVRQDTAGGTLTPGQVALNVTSGALTGLLGVLGGKLSATLGLEDINTLFAGGRAGIVGEKELSIFKKVIHAALSGAKEGLVEELPQSVQEQIAQNLSLGKPIDEKVVEQGAIGMLAGFAQGSGAQLAGNLLSKTRPQTPVQKALETDSHAKVVEEALQRLDPDGTINPPPITPIVPPEAAGGPTGAENVIDITPA
ncbi:hypothetical protein EHM76_02150, partial [bacterium]